MTAYLASTDIINWKNRTVFSQAMLLSQELDDKLIVTKRCFNFVRDTIAHSGDAQRGPVTLKASDVLKYKTGFCYAKSHLLAALLRANGIEAGLCYQRLLVDDRHKIYCLHGLNAAKLDSNDNWYRFDARGNNNAVKTIFSYPDEDFAYASTKDGEYLVPKIFENPIPEVVGALQGSDSWRRLESNLPDLIFNYSIVE